MRALFIAAPIVIAPLLASPGVLAQDRSQSWGSAGRTDGAPFATTGRPTIAPNLPGPAVGENASPQDFLRAAQGALAAGRSREAQQSLEMAQTRMLDRSVPYGQTNSPSASASVGRVSEALRALGAGDRAGAMMAIQAALTSPP